jgi:hypothetical protein
MSSLADLPELVGFFSYSRRDDEHSQGSLSRLRARIFSELRLQLGRDFRLWQDTAAIPDGALWEDEIRRAISGAVFFIPIVTPSAVHSEHCRFEFGAFLRREAELGRSDLVFPVLYVTVEELEREDKWRCDDVLRTIGSRQYLDWRPLRHLEHSSTEVGQKIEQFCRNVARALRKELPGAVQPVPARRGAAEAAGAENRNASPTEPLAMRSAAVRAREDIAAGSRGEAAEPVIQSAAGVGTAGDAAPARSPTATVDDRATSGARSDEMRTRRLNRARYGVLVTLAIGVLLCLLAVLVRDTSSLLAAVGGTAFCYTFVYRNIPRDLATARLVFLILTGILGYFLLSNLQVGLANTHSPIWIYVIIEAVDMAVCLFVLYHLQSAIGTAQSNEATLSR